MTWLASKLNRRVQICQNAQEEASSGGFAFVKSVLTTVWCSVKPLSEYQYIRGEMAGEGSTHIFEVRRGAVASLGVAFGAGFSSDFDSIADLNPLKSDMYLFLEEGSTTKGRLFKIDRFKDKDEKKEYLMVLAKEIEERGTGFPA